LQKVDKKIRHILIGGNGFLGKAIISKIKLLSNHNFLVVDIDQIPSKCIDQNKYIQCDISNTQDVNKIPFKKGDVIHHLASKLIIPNKPRFNRYNFFAATSILGTQNIINHMKRKKLKNLIFWSTDMVYGIQKKFPISEEAIPRPLGDYGNTKLIAESTIMQEVNNNKINCTIFRPRLIIGPGRLGILKKLFWLARHNLPIPIIGNGENIFQFVSVDDCAKASLKAAMQNCPSEVYNLGSSNPVKTKILLKCFLNNIGSKSILVPLPSKFVKSILAVLNFLKISPMDVEQFKIADKNMFLSTAKVKNKLGWVSNDQDLEMLCAAYLTYKDSNDT
jgi:dTDP-glucose 4,6-dehydratase